MMDMPDAVYGALAGVWVAVTAFFGISWFKDLSARVRHLEDVIVAQEAKITELKETRNRLRERLHRYGIEEDSDGALDEETSIP